MVIVDTTVWIDYFGGIDNPETRWLDVEVDVRRLGLADVILCEVLQGIRTDAEVRKVQRELLKCEIFATGGAEFAIATARNFRELRRKGFTVRKTIDCWIATFCLQGGHSLLHRDRDFDAFEKALGLSVIHPDLK
jgi:predicted nucleic acid-binding protein